MPYPGNELIGINQVPQDTLQGALVGSRFQHVGGDPPYFPETPVERDHGAVLVNDKDPVNGHFLLRRKEYVPELQLLLCPLPLGYVLNRSLQVEGIARFIQLLVSAY